MDNFQEVTNREIQDIASPIVAPLLEPLGFESQKLLYWINSRNAPVRQIFSLRKFKGGKLAPAWGISLDFVPHLSGKKLKWHRTHKSAIFDLTVDPREPELELTYFRGPDEIREQAGFVLSEAINRAKVFWQQSDSIEKLPETIELLKQYLATGGLGFYNYTQHPIAYSLVLAKNERYREAEAEMNIYIDRMGIPEEVQTKLWKLLHGANVA